MSNTHNGGLVPWSSRLISACPYTTEMQYAALLKVLNQMSLAKNHVMRLLSVLFSLTRFIPKYAVPCGPNLHLNTYVPIRL